MRREDFETIRFQVTAFYKADEFKASKIFAFLAPHAETTYDGDSLLVPDRLAAGTDLPRVLFRDKEETKEFRLSANRADILWDGSAVAGADLLDVYRIAANLLSLAMIEFSFGVIRLATVLTRKADLPAPGSVSAAFLKESQLSRPSNPFADAFDIQIRVQNRIRYLDWFDVNSLVRFYGGAPMPEDGGDPDELTILFVDQELNTAVVPAGGFTARHVGEFFLGCENRMQDILRAFFEGERQ